jgi:hypothetical protein
VSDVVYYAQQFTARGYSVYPVNIELDSNGAKVPHFKWTPESPGWKNGQYPTDPDEIAKHWEGFDGIAINMLTVSQGDHDGGSVRRRG